MKREIILAASIVIFVAFAGIASAGCVNDAQTIMRLSAVTNAHGALWNQDYGVKICYDDYFSEPYTGNDAHDCGEVLLKLNSINNAHAAEADYDGYSINVCHNGLKNCEIAAGRACPDNKAAVVYLNNLTNSHISRTRSLEDYSQGYYAVCCEGQSEVVPSIVPTLCADYTSRTECNTAPLSLAMGDAGCRAGGSCRCTWNGTTETSGRCVVSWQIVRGECTYSCSVEATDQTSCNHGSKIVALTAHLTPVSGTNCLAASDPECRSGSATVPCGSAEAQLPFFGGWQIIGSLMVVSLIYVFLNGKRNYIRHS